MNRTRSLISTTTPNKAVKRDVDVALSTNLGFGGHDACVAFKKI